MSDLVKLVLSLVGFLILLIVSGLVLANYAVKRNMDNAAFDILNAQTTDIPRKNDGYSNLLVYDYEILKDRRIAKVTNVGGDGLLGTEDDWSVTKIDYNKSYLGGKFVGERAKQFLDGVIEGDKTPSKFEEK